MPADRVISRPVARVVPRERARAAISSCGADRRRNPASEPAGLNRRFIACYGVVKATVMGGYDQHRMSGGGGNDRLEFLRRVARENVIPVPSRFKRHGYRKPSRRHKSTRQLVADESKRISSLLQEEGAAKRVPKVTFFNVNGPPSMRPTKKYCDITGLKGPYKSPVNNLRYHNAEIYQLVVKPMAPGVDQEYLKLRGDHFVLK